MSCEDNIDKYVDDQMKCEGVVESLGDGDYLVRGRVVNGSAGILVSYWAANPPTYITSFSGSGLPYANPLMAYENTPNRGAVRTSAGGRFQFRIRYPNAYYVGLGTVYVPPHVNVKICDKSEPEVHRIELGDGIPFRTLTYAPPPLSYPRQNPFFYSGRETLPIRTQEQVLRDSAFPPTNKYPQNFWGLKPPM